MSEKLKLLSFKSNRQLKIILSKIIETLPSKEKVLNPTLFNVIADDYCPFIDPKTLNKDLDYLEFSQLTLV